MLDAYKKWDDRLIKTKPHLWLAQVHFFIPTALLLLLVSVVYAFCAPLKYGVTLNLIINISLISFVLIRVFMHQVKYGNNVFSHVQLYTLFAINVAYFFCCLFIISIVPYVFASKISSNFDGDNFELLQKELRLAMIKIDYIKHLKQDNKPPAQQDVAVDATKDATKSQYIRQLENQMKDNKFIFEEPEMGDTYFDVESFEDTLTSVPPSVVERNHYSDSLSADSTSEDVYLNSKAYYSISFIRQMPYVEIYAIKDKINSILINHGLDIYSGDSIPEGLVQEEIGRLRATSITLKAFSSSDINKYYDKITMQIDTLNATKTLRNNLDYILSLALTSGIFVCHLVLMLVVRLRFLAYGSFGKRYNTTKRKAALGLWIMLSLMLSIVLNFPVIDGYEPWSVYLGQIFAGIYLNLNYYAFCAIILLILAWYLFKLVKQKKAYSKIDYYKFVAACLYLPIILFFIFYLICMKDEESSYLLTALALSSLISALALLVLNYFLIPKCHFLSNMPE